MAQTPPHEQRQLQRAAMKEVLRMAQELVRVNTGHGESRRRVGGQQHVDRLL